MMTCRLNGKISRVNKSKELDQKYIDFYFVDFSRQVSSDNIFKCVLIFLILVVYHHNIKIVDHNLILLNLL